MNGESYLPWVIRETPTCWWHDSAQPGEVDWAIAHGAVGATTNPYLCHRALAHNRATWQEQIAAAIAGAKDAQSKAEALMRIPVTSAAAKFRPIFERTGGKQGWVCAQVNPARAGDRAPMLEMARRFRNWAPNVTVKLPATAAGLDVLEECVAEGITVTATVSFTLPQVIAVAERHRAGIARAKSRGIAPGGCFAVLMIGRLDDYIRELASDAKISGVEQDVHWCGIIVAKRAAAMFAQRGYEAGLIIAAFRGLYHMTELVGGNLIMSIAKQFQEPLLSPDIPRESRIEKPVPDGPLTRFSTLIDFARSYMHDGLTPDRFLSFGLTQRTLAFFTEAGWKLMEQF